MFLVLDGCSGHKESRDYKCPLHKPKKNDVSVPALEFSAFINYWLAIKKVEDDYNDTNNPFKKFFLKLTKKFLAHNRKYKLRARKFEAIVDSMSKDLEEYYYIENNSEDFDDLANGFAAFLSGLFKAYFIQYENETDSSLISEISFHVAKLIYVADAFDDYWKDIKCRQFNPLKKISSECADQTVFIQEVFNMVRCISLQTVESLQMLNCGNMDLIANYILYFDRVLVQIISQERGRYTWKKQPAYQIFTKR